MHHARSRKSRQIHNYGCRPPLNLFQDPALDAALLDAVYTNNLTAAAALLAAGADPNAADHVSLVTSGKVPKFLLSLPAPMDGPPMDP